MAETPQALPEELRSLAKRGIDYMYDWVSGKPPLVLPNLERIIEARFPGTSDGSKEVRIEAVKRIMLEAIKFLPEKETIPGTTFEWRSTARILYRFEDIELPPDFKPPPGERLDRNRDYDRRVTALRLSRHMTRTPMGDATGELRLQLAKRLENPDAYASKSLFTPSAQAESTESESSVFSNQSSYISRDALESSIEEALSPSHLVMLHGEGGTGKTWLAYRVASRVTDHCIIRTSQPSTMFDDISAHLIRRQLAKGDESNDVLLRKFKRLLADPERAPALVVLDDIGSFDDLKVLIPGEHQTRILVTTRSKLPAYGSNTYVPISSLTVDEARSYIDQRMPEIEALAAGKLIQVLSGRVLALKHACSYLARYPSVSVDEFCSAVEFHAGQVLGDAPTDPEEATLTSVYREVLKKVSTEAYSMGLSFELLKLIVYSGFPEVFRRVLELGAEEFIHLDNTPNVHLASIDRALEYLGNLSLIGLHHQSVAIHPLTKSIMQDLLHEQADGACSRVLVALNRRGKEALLEIRELFESVDYDVFRDSAERNRCIIILQRIQAEEWEIERVRSGLLPEKYGNAWVESMRRAFEEEVVLAAMRPGLADYILRMFVSLPQSLRPYVCEHSEDWKQGQATRFFDYSIEMRGDAVLVRVTPFAR